MPVMDGMELTSKIRRDLGLRDIPVIILSASADKVQQIELFKNGITDYLTKPFIKEELLARMQAHFDVAKMNKQLKVALQEVKFTKAELEKNITFERKDSSFVFSEEAYYEIYNRRGKLLTKGKAKTVDMSKVYCSEKGLNRLVLNGTSHKF